MSSQVVGNLYSEKSLAIVSSALLFAMIDALIARQLLDEAEIESILQRAQTCIAKRHGSICAGESAELLSVLSRRFLSACADAASHSEKVAPPL